MRSQTKSLHASFSTLLPGPPVLSSQLSGWENLYLESICIPSQKRSSICIDQHLICINDGQRVHCEIRVPGHLKRFLLLANELMIIPAKTDLTIRTNRVCKITTLSLPCELLSHHAIALWASHKFELTPTYPVQDLLIAHVSKALKSELISNPRESKTYAKIMANALAVHLLQNFSNHTQHPAIVERELSDKKLQKVLDYIDAHLEQKIALLDLATLIECSQHRFSHAFKQSTGLSPYQYIIQQRVEQAKRLLKQNSMNICEISVACGFSHQSHLNRHFKRIVGTTPSVFQSGKAPYLKAIEKLATD